MVAILDYFHILFLLGLIFLILYLYSKIVYLIRINKCEYIEIETEILSIDSCDSNNSNWRGKLRYYINDKKYIHNGFVFYNLKLCDVRAGQKVKLLCEKDNPNKLYELGYLRNTSLLYLIIGLLMILLSILR